MPKSTCGCLDYVSTYVYTQSGLWTRSTEKQTTNRKNQRSKCGLQRGRYWKHYLGSQVQPGCVLQQIRVEKRNRDDFRTRHSFSHIEVSPSRGFHGALHPVGGARQQ